jgi:phosphate transport system permease protein
MEAIDTFRGRFFSRRAMAAVFFAMCVFATLFGIASLAVLLVDILREGVGRLSLDFINSFPSRNPAQAGIKSALFGTVWMMSITGAFAIPIGIGAAIDLEEYSDAAQLADRSSRRTSRTWGVPSIFTVSWGCTLVRAMDRRLRWPLTMACSCRR